MRGHVPCDSNSGLLDCYIRFESPKKTINDARHRLTPTIISKFASLVIERQQIVVLRPIAFGHQEDHVRIRRLMLFVQAPNEVRGLN